MKLINNKLVAVTCSITSALMLVSPTINAEEEGSKPVLEEIIVTAQRREQTLADIPLSVVVVDSAILKEQAITDMNTLQYSVPNFTQTETAIGTNVFIRGIGSGNNQGFEQSVGIYVDGIHHGRAQQARAPFLDLSRVEVLRGPQSILFGKNSVAGALNMTTAKPTNEFEGYFNLSHEFNHAETEGTVVLSGPFSDRFRYRIAGRYSKLDGYIENLTLNRKEPNRDYKTLRTTFEYDISDTVIARLKIESNQFDVAGRPTEIIYEAPAVDGPFTGLNYSQILVGVFGQDESLLNNFQDGKRHSTGDFSMNDQFEAVFTLDWELENSTLESITGISNFEFNDLCDCDFTGANIFSLNLSEKYDQFSQEIRLTSEGGDKIDYIVGAFYQSSKHEYHDALIANSTTLLIPLLNARSPGLGNLFANTSTPRTAMVDSEVFSVFGQIDWHLNDTMSLQLGGRLTHETKEGYRNITIAAADGSPLPAAQAIVADFYGALFGFSASNALNVAFPVEALLGTHPVNGSISDTVFTPDVKFYWDVSDDVMIYISGVKGSKSGGFDFRANNRGTNATMAEAFEFDSETAYSYELGGKMSLADGAAEVNFAFYSTQFNNLQVSIFDGKLGFNVGNAAKSEVQGLEVDGRWQITESITLGGSLALNDFKFKDYTNGRCNFGQAPNGPQADDGFCDYSGQTNRLVSDWQGTFSASHFHELSGGWELNSSFNMFFTDKYNASPTLDPVGIQDAYTKYNLRFSVKNPDNGWEVALLGKNLTDEKIYLNVGDVPLSGTTFGAISKAGVVGRGRTVALQVSKEF